MTYEDSDVGFNWAQNYHYAAQSILRPTSAQQLRDIIARGTPVRALGSRHSFTDIADTVGDLVSLEDWEGQTAVDAELRQVSVAAGIRYGHLASALHDEGWAIHNMASLPHISVAGAVSTATHGSGDNNGNLATAVAAVEFVNGLGELITLRRGEPDFSGAVVALGALGILTRVVLDIEPTFDVRQDVYTDLRWDDALNHFDAVTSSAYSVSMFTNWLGETIGTTWLKSRMDAPEPPVTLLGAPRAATEVHMLPGNDPINTTPQLGVSGPWSERLAHFRLEFTPSNGNELQSEYLVPRANIRAALEGLRDIGERIEPLLMITELRTMAKDDLWLSGAYNTDAVGIHFTWKMDEPAVRALLPDIEAILLPLGARPHWGKVFTASAVDLAGVYPRLDDFRELVARHDPNGLFRNAFLERTLGI
ncbi:MAG TPA: D-arabinono-1,4-lactone oxidase [Glaciihabitans sp.]|jgi:xylitol oxidase|nr:D-arabinono-1,4-lactone oxidase [Glaciihabitans sp.]